MKPAVKLAENDKTPKTYLDKRGAVMMRQLLRLDCLALKLITRLQEFRTTDNNNSVNLGKMQYCLKS
jgi:hypothetical protein